jgi:hypothetical protein
MYNIFILRNIRQIITLTDKICGLQNNETLSVSGFPTIRSEFVCLRFDKVCSKRFKFNASLC